MSRTTLIFCFRVISALGSFFGLLQEIESLVASSGDDSLPEKALKKNEKNTMR